MRASLILAVATLLGFGFFLFTKDTAREQAQIAAVDTAPINATSVVPPKTTPLPDAVEPTTKPTATPNGDKAPTQDVKPRPVPRPELVAPKTIQRNAEQQREWEIVLDILNANLPSEKAKQVAGVFEDVCLERLTPIERPPSLRTASADDLFAAMQQRADRSSLDRVRAFLDQDQVVTLFVRPNKVLKNVYRACPYKETYIQ